MIAQHRQLIIGDGQGSCIGVRRLARTSDVQLYETDNPRHIIQAGKAVWAHFLAGIKECTYQPKTYGNLVIVSVDDPLEPNHSGKPLITTVSNWAFFEHKAQQGAFDHDRLPPAPLGLACGPWETGRTIHALRPGDM